MKIKGKSAYYSHSIRIYNTKEERDFFAAINKKFMGTVICPNNHIGKLTNKQDYASIVKKMDCIFVSEYKEYIGCGSYRECSIAIKDSIPVYLVEKNGNAFSFRLVKSVDVENEFNPISHATFTLK